MRLHKLKAGESQEDGSIKILVILEVLGLLWRLG